MQIAILPAEAARGEIEPGKELPQRMTTFELRRGARLRGGRTLTAVSGVSLQFGVPHHPRISELLFRLRCLKILEGVQLNLQALLRRNFFRTFFQQ